MAGDDGEGTPLRIKEIAVMIILGLAGFIGGLFLSRFAIIWFSKMWTAMLIGVVP